MVEISASEFRQHVIDCVPTITSLEITRADDRTEVRGRITTPAGSKIFQGEYLAALTREYADILANTLTHEVKCSSQQNTNS